MWLLSQEKILGPEDREKFAPAPPFPSKAIADGHDAGGHPPGAGALLAQPAIADLIPEARIEAADTLAASRALSPQNEPAVSGPPLHRATPIDDRAGVLPVLAGRESDDPRGDDLQMEIPAIDNLTVDDSPPPAGSASTRAIPRSFLDLHVKLRFHRADLYLGIAVLVAFLALLFPATATQRPRLRPWERMLIAMGIAEAPQPAAVHHAGDPNVKVWVDTHTALYYCPGTELYGKSPDGHYSTQREAQLDRFEPAERVVCVE